MKTLYRDTISSFQDLEQLSNQVLSLVGVNGKQLVRREWERAQSKSHHINTTILKVLTNFRFDFTELSSFFSRLD